jgi:hypothetical protein
MALFSDSSSKILRWLGLAIARAHGGNVRVERGADGAGATFVGTMHRDVS